MRIVGEMKAPVRLLTYPTLKRFVISALQFYRENKSEPSVD